MKRLYLRNNLILIFAGLILLCATSFACADDTVYEYKINVNIRQDSTAEYTSNISIGFEQPVDTYEFMLPTQLKGVVYDIEVSNYDYSYNQDTNSIIITNSDGLFEGRKNFTFNYKADGVNNYGKTADCLNLYLFSPSINTSVEKLGISIKYPEGFEWVKFKSDYSEWTFDKGARRITLAEQNYIPSAEINIHFELPIAYWANSTELGATRDFALIMLLAGIAIFVILRLIFKNDDNLEIIACKFPPESTTPAQAGYAIDGVVDDRDFMASLLYLAQKGYIRIVEYELHKFRFIYIKEPKGDKKSIEVLVKMLFGDGKVGCEVELVSIQDRIRKNMRKFKRAIYHDFNGSFRFLTTASNAAGVISMVTYFAVTAILPLMNYINRGVNVKNITDGIISAVLFAAGLTLLLILVCNVYRKMKSRRGDGNSRRFTLFCCLYVAAGAIYVLMYRFAYNGRHADTLTTVAAAIFLIIAPLMLMGMRTLSASAKRLVGQIMGLKQYIETADKIEVMEISKDNPEYFFTLLPYSYLFCKSHKLAALFELTEVDSPDWYIPYGLSEGYTYDVVVFNSMTNNLQIQLNETVFRLSQQ